MAKAQAQAAVAAKPFNPRDLMSQPTDTFVKPPPLPAGHYYGEIVGHKLDKSRQKQTNFVAFEVKINGASEDVEASEVEDIDFSNIRKTINYYITPGAMWRLRKFLDDVLGEEEGRSFDERIADTRGVPVLLEITHRPAGDGSDDVYTDVKTIVAANG
jgi:hypothetical protein